MNRERRINIMQCECVIVVEIKSAKSVATQQVDFFWPCKNRAEYCFSALRLPAVVDCNSGVARVCTVAKPPSFGMKKKKLSR